MTETKALLRLQEIDLELLRLHRDIDALPQRKKVAAVRAATKKVSSQLTQIVGSRKDLEMDLADREADHARMSQIVTEVQTKVAESDQDYRAIKDFESQLTALAKRLEKIEFETQGIMAELERTEKAEANARELGKRLESEERSLIESFRHDAGGLKARVDELDREREAVTAELPLDLLGRYDAARKRFGTIAVETLEGNKPSACRVSLQASQYADLKHGPKITDCPYCHRILVIEDGE